MLGGLSSIEAPLKYQHDSGTIFSALNPALAKTTTMRAYYSDQRIAQQGGYKFSLLARNRYWSINIARLLHPLA